MEELLWLPTTALQVIEIKKKTIILFKLITFFSDIYMETVLEILIRVFSILQQDFSAKFDQNASISFQ